MGKGDRLRGKETDQKEGPFSDSKPSWVYSSINSSKLGYLVAVYRKGLQGAEKRALKDFWSQAKRLRRGKVRLKTGLILDRMSEEEILLLKEAENGSLKAIQKLIGAHPGSMELPFVRDEMRKILEMYKVNGRKSEPPLVEIREVIWPGFLPDRRGRTLHISDDGLRHRIKLLMNSPVENVLIDLNRRRILSEHGLKTALAGANLSELISEVETKGFLTKEIACRIIESYFPVNQKKIRSIRIRERSGRPHKKIP